MVKEAEYANKLEIPAIAIFPHIEPELKDAKGSIAFISDPAIERTCNECSKQVIFMENLNDVQALDEADIFIDDALDELIWLKDHLEDKYV